MKSFTRGCVEEGEMIRSKSTAVYSVAGVSARDALQPLIAPIMKVGVFRRL